MLHQMQLMKVLHGGSREVQQSCMCLSRMRAVWRSPPLTTSGPSRCLTQATLHII